MKDRYSSHESRNSRSALITAYWVTSGGQIIEYRDIDLTARPGRMKFFLKHIIFIGKECYGHWFANVEWFYPLTDDLKNEFEKSMEIWQRLIFEQFGRASFIPVFPILSKFVYDPFEYRSKKLMVVNPRLSFSDV